MKKLNKGIFASVLMGATLFLGACTGVDHDKDYSVYSEGISTASTVDDTAVCSGYSAKNIAIINDNKNMIVNLLVKGNEGVSITEYQTMINKTMESLDKVDMIMNTQKDELLVEYFMNIKSAVVDLNDSVEYYAADQDRVSKDDLEIELYSLKEYSEAIASKVEDAKCN